MFGGRGSSTGSELGAFSVLNRLHQRGVKAEKGDAEALQQARSRGQTRAVHRFHMGNQSSGAARVHHWLCVSLHFWSLKSEWGQCAFDAAPLSTNQL